MEKKKNTPPAGECRGCAALRHGDCAPAGAHGDAPPIFFLRHQKENAPCTVEKKKCWAQNRHVVPFLLQYGGRCSRCGADLPACTGCAWAFGNREMLSRIWGRGCGFRPPSGKGFQRGGAAVLIILKSFSPRRVRGENTPTCAPLGRTHQ